MSISSISYISLLYLYLRLMCLFQFFSRFGSGSVGRTVGHSFRWASFSNISFVWVCVCGNMHEFLFPFKSPIERWRTRNRYFGVGDTFGAHCAKTWAEPIRSTILFHSLHLLTANIVVRSSSPLPTKIVLKIFCATHSIFQTVCRIIYMES